VFTRLHPSLSFHVTVVPNISSKVGHSISPPLYTLAYISGLDKLFASCSISLVQRTVQELDLLVRMSKHYVCHFLQDPLVWLPAKAVRHCRHCKRGVAVISVCNNIPFH
jgi:hypothetical protein